MISFYHWDQVLKGEHLFLVVSGIISGIWLLGNETWKKRIDMVFDPAILVRAHSYLFS